MHATDKVVGPFHEWRTCEKYYIFNKWVELQQIKEKTYYFQTKFKNQYIIKPFSKLRLNPVCLYKHLDDDTLFIKINTQTQLKKDEFILESFGCWDCFGYISDCFNEYDEYDDDDDVSSVATTVKLSDNDSSDDYDDELYVFLFFLYFFEIKNVYKKK